MHTNKERTVTEMRGKIHLVIPLAPLAEGDAEGDAP